MTIKNLELMSVSEYEEIKRKELESLKKTFLKHPKDPKNIRRLALAFLSIWLPKSVSKKPEKREAIAKWAREYLKLLLSRCSLSEILATLNEDEKILFLERYRRYKRGEPCYGVL